MENTATANERRFNQRHQAAALKVELFPLGWFNISKRKHKAFAQDFSLGGISIVATSKFKAEQKLLINLDCGSHRLQAIPMLVTRCVENNKEYTLALQFNLGDLPNAARTAAFSVLKSIENELKQSVAA